MVASKGGMVMDKKRSLEKVCCERMQQYIDKGVIVYDETPDLCFIKPPQTEDLVEIDFCPFCRHDAWGFGEESL